MIYISVNDFLEKARSCSAMGRQEEIECARRMKNGDTLARERLIRSYLPMVASYIARIPPHLQSLELILYCQQALEKATDTFNFFQNSEPFSHRLSWHLRNATAKYIANR